MMAGLAASPEASRPANAARSAASGASAGSTRPTGPVRRGTRPARSTDDLPRPRRSDQDQRQRFLLVGQGGQEVRDILAAEEPPGVLPLEAGQAVVGGFGAAGPPAGRAPGPLQGAGPPGQHGGIGLAARPQDPEQLLRPAVGRQVPSGKVVARRADGQPGGPRDLPHGQPRARPDRGQLPAEVLLGGDAIRIRRAVSHQPPPNAHDRALWDGLRARLIPLAKLMNFGPNGPIRSLRSLNLRRSYR
jgi:hypothetical protein